MLLSLCCAWLAAVVFATAASAEPVTLTTADGVKVFGEFWPAASANAPLILAFHQAGSSHAEYTPLAPRLNQAGFSVLAIDQRSGNGEFGGMNQTVAALGRSTTYDAVLPDLEAALVWGREHAQGAPLLVWGSSYSAALVFVLAAKHPTDIQGLLAFSPGEYLGKRGAVADAARSVDLVLGARLIDEHRHTQRARRMCRCSSINRAPRTRSTLRAASWRRPPAAPTRRSSCRLAMACMAARRCAPIATRRGPKRTGPRCSPFWPNSRAHVERRASRCVHARTTR
jgi:alpha-beta hydrolase superfamily lysophospholipase